MIEIYLFDLIKFRGKKQVHFTLLGRRNPSGRWENPVCPEGTFQVDMYDAGQMWSAEC